MFKRARKLPLLTLHGPRRPVDIRLLSKYALGGDPGRDNKLTGAGGAASPTYFLPAVNKFFCCWRNTRLFGHSPVDQRTNSPTLAVFEPARGADKKDNSRADFLPFKLSLVLAI